MKKLFQITAMALSVMMLVASCNKDEENAGEGRMEIRMTDAPGPYQAVYVDIQAVEASTDKGWVSLNVNKGIYNLLDYRGGLDTLIASGPINAGRVEQIRLVLGSNNSIVLGGTTFPLETPSAQQSGLKLNVHATIQAGQTHTILLDFDAARSVVETGSGKYILKPVIRAILEPDNGVITGTLPPAAAGSVVYAIRGNDTVGAVANLTGFFYIRGLATGIYTVNIMPVAPYDEKVIANVSVLSGQTTDLGNIGLVIK